MRWVFLCALVSAGCSDPASNGRPDTASGGSTTATTGGSGGGTGVGGTQASTGGSNVSGGTTQGGSASGAAGGAEQGGTTSVGGTTTGSGGGYGGTGLGGTGAGELTGDPGIWENVTPDGVDLSSDFGAQDVLADPANPGIFYGFVCYQGVYKSTDWGTSWAHVSTDGKIEQGRPWGEAMAPDGSYMLACNGYGVNEGAEKSTDGGVTWTSHTISSDNDPYNFDIDRFDKDHVLTAMHASDHIYESTDAGETWADKGSAGTGGSNYIFFITSATWISIGQDGSGSGTRRTTNSGSSWADAGPMEHAHGNAQIFIDPDTGDIYAGGHGGGVHRSTDDGASFTEVSETRSSTVFGTGAFLYATDPGATGSGTDPMAQFATRSSGTDWAASTVPSGMNNGAKRAATMFDSTKDTWVIISGNWNAGFWRYIEE